MWCRCLLLFTLSVFVRCEILNKYEGSKCSWKGVSGTCVNIFKCESASIYLKDRDYPPICSFQGKDPVICCTDCYTVNDTRKIIFNPQAGKLYLTGPKAKDKCVHYIDKLEYDCKINTTARIIHEFSNDSNCYVTGVGVSFSQVTLTRRESYMALLGYGNDMETAQWLCAGALISETFIVTAAHCLSDSSLGPVKYVALGITNRTDPPELWQKYNVKRTIPHPEYRPPSKYHDIALLETDKMITFNREVLPACLHTDEIAEYKAEVIVWDTKNQGTLQPVSLSYFDPIQCSIFYPPNDDLENGFNETIQSCYGDTESPTDSCQSDSGGPLVETISTSGCATDIFGVTAIERICGSVGSSGLYTKVQYYVPWIEDIVWP